MSNPLLTRPAVARVLRRFREQSGISQERLAASAAVDRTYVGSVERGHRNPTILMVDRLLEVIGVTWVEFAVALGSVAG